MAYGVHKQKRMSGHNKYLMYPVGHKQFGSFAQQRSYNRTLAISASMKTINWWTKYMITEVIHDVRNTFNLDFLYDDGVRISVYPANFAWNRTPPKIKKPMIKKRRW